MKTNKQHFFLGFVLLSTVATVSSNYGNPSDPFSSGKTAQSESPSVSNPPLIDDTNRSFYNDRLPQVCQLNDGVYSLGSLAAHQLRCERNREI